MCHFCDRTMQTVQLDKHIRLLDSPGIVVASNLADDAAVVLRNCVRVSISLGFTSFTVPPTLPVRLDE